VQQILDSSTAQELIEVYVKDVGIARRIQIENILVDGLDEAPYQKRSEVIEKAEKFAEKLNCGLTLSSRKIELLENPRAGYKEYELLPFELKQAINLLSKFLANNQLMLSALTEGLERLRLHFPLIPLSLRMLVSLAEESKEIPSSITELYERYFDLVLGRYDLDKGITVLFDYLVKKRLLGFFAYELFFCKNQLQVPRNEFDEYINSYGKNFISDWSLSKKGEMIQELKRSGLLHFNDNVSFRHRTYLDYFVANHMTEYQEEIDDLEETLAQAHFSQRWEDVTFFYIGLRRRLPEKVLKSILSYESSDDLGDRFGKVMVGRLLQAGWNSSASTKFRGISEGVSHLPEVRQLFLKQL
jgi:hypothetical protein